MNYLVITKAFIFSLLGNGFYFLTGVYLSRKIGANGYGHYSVAVTISSLAFAVATMGLDKLAIKLVPRYQVTNCLPLLGGFVTRSTQLILVNSILISLIGFISYYFYTLYYPSTKLHPAILVLFFLPFMSIAIFLSRLLNVSNRFLISVLIYRIFIPVTLLVGILFANYFHHLSKETAILIYGFSCTGSFIAYAIFLKKDLIKIWEYPREHLTTIWIKESFHFFLNTIMVIFLNQIGILALKILDTNENTSAVGIYAAVISICSFALLLTKLINEFFSSFLAKALLGKKNEILLLLASQRKTNTFAALVVLIISFGFGKSLLQLFGPQFSQGINALYILTISIAFNFIFNTYPTILQYLGKLKLVSLSYIILSTSTIILSFILIPHFGVTGAALSIAIPNSIFYLFLFIRGHSELKKYLATCF